MIIFIILKKIYKKIKVIIFLFFINFFLIIILNIIYIYDLFPILNKILIEKIYNIFICIP